MFEGNFRFLRLGIFDIHITYMVFKKVTSIEVAEAGEVKEAAEVLRPEKSLLWTSESSRFLNSALF